MSRDPVLPPASLEVQTPSGQWEPYLAPARAVSITRGGERAGLVNSVDAGLLSVDLVNAGDPANDPNVKPNAPVRLTVTSTDEQTIDLGTVEIRNGGGYQTIISRDPLRIMNEPKTNELANTDIRIPTPLRQHQEYALTIDLTSAGADQVTVKHDEVVEILPRTPSRSVLTFYGRARQPYPALIINTGKTTFGANHTQYIIHAITLAVENVDSIYTGVVQDVATTHTRDDHTFTSIVSADAVQSHSNTMRFGAVVEGGGAFEPWAARMRRLAGSAEVPVEIPTVGTSRIVYDYAVDDIWRPFMDEPTKPTPVVNRTVLTTTPEQPPATWMRQTESKPDSVATAYRTGVQHDVTGLVPGRSYTFAARGVIVASQSDPLQIATNYALGIDGIGWGAVRTLSHAQAPRDLTPYSFVATSSTHTMRIGLAQTITGANVPAGAPLQNAAFYGMRVTELVDDPYMLQDIVYESTLLNHFDLACNSVGASWFVDKNGITQFRRWNARPSIVANFRDERYEIADSELVYTNLITNPSFETGTAGVTPAAGVASIYRSTGVNGVVAGAYCLGVDGALSGITANNAQLTTDTQPGSVAAGEHVAFGWNLRRSSSGANLTVSIGVNWLDATGGFISSMYRPYEPMPTGAASNPANRRNIGLGAAPAGTDHARIVIRVRAADGISAAPAGWQMHTDAWTAVAGDSASAVLAGVSKHFDGDTPPTRDLILSWTGTPHASTSEAWTKADPLHVPYTALDLAYDTRNVINDLGIEQHGRQLDPDQGWIADDYSVPFTNQASINQWGKRAGTLDTSLYDEGAYQGSVTSRALDLLDENGTPVRTPLRVTFNAMNHLRLVARLDITDRVTVTRKGVTFTCRVVGITHEIEPTQWLVTLQLGKD